MKAPWGGDTAYAWEKYDSFADRWREICRGLKTKTDNRRLNAKRDEESRLGREWQNITKKKAAALDVVDEHMED
ncbi:hypothetical protein COL26b_013493 [Colletotrichum chrysophilum]|uniref:uncharacterized protein n=1 Tax=Colletotrichum chrysophilum TaxID=1836956 RepID=UPI002301F4B5|nr:uncharacterized protein COL26b_013493 [Colletotrichum chrysophilum]KAJ0362046.1 hypothetical protein COL26b_013493 [Colletotrichum chrysophilum]